MAKADQRRTPLLTWRLEALGYDLITGLIRALPVEAASALGGMALRLIGPMSSAHRTARTNLRLAFPGLSRTEQDRLLGAQWENFGRYVFEFPVLDRLTPASGRVRIVGSERFDAIKASGKPVIFISGHFSNLEVMPAVILAAGIACDITYRAANNPLVDARIRQSRKRYGVQMFAPKGGDGARDLLEALSAGRSVAMMNDQKYDGGVAGTFFGHPVQTLPAAVRLALKFGVVIQPMSIQRTRGARFVCVLHDPIGVTPTHDRPADIAAGVAAINHFIETRVRERPQEWWWMHKRWPAEVYARAASEEVAQKP